LSLSTEHGIHNPSGAKPQFMGSSEYTSHMLSPLGHWCREADLIETS